MPFPTVTGTLTTDPDEALPPVVVAVLDWFEVDDCEVELLDEVVESLLLERDGEPPAEPFVLLAVPAVLPAEEEPLWFVVALPPLAVLDAGAETPVFPPLLFPSTATLLPFPTVTGALITDPEVAFPPFVVAVFDWVELADCEVELLDEVDEPLLPERGDELVFDPFVLLLVPAVLPAEDEPPWFVVVAFPPSAVLDAGADTIVVPPLLLPSTARLLPFATVTGALPTEPDLASPPVVVAVFDCVELEDCVVVLLDEVDGLPLPHHEDEPDFDPFVALLVPAVLPAEEEPCWFVVAEPPFAVLEAGASTKVLPPLLRPSRTALLPFPPVSGALRTEPEVARPPVVVAAFDCDEVAVWPVLFEPTTLASAAVAVNAVSDPTMRTPSMPRLMWVRMCVVLLYLVLRWTDGSRSARVRAERGGGARAASRRPESDQSGLQSSTKKGPAGILASGARRFRCTRSTMPNAAAPSHAIPPAAPPLVPELIVPVGAASARTFCRGAVGAPRGVPPPEGPAELAAGAA